MDDHELIFSKFPGFCRMALLANYMLWPREAGMFELSLQREDLMLR